MFNQYQTVQGEIEREEDTIFYSVSWVREMPTEIVQMNEIEKVSIVDSDGVELKEYYQDHRDEIDDLVVEDASKHEPTYWERPSYREYKEYQMEVSNG